MLEILLTQMRREGFEMTVSPPKVLIKINNGKKEEPIEEITMDLDEEYSSKIIDSMNRRKGKLIDLKDTGKNKKRLIFHAPTRGLMGYTSRFLTLTKGTGVKTESFTHMEITLAIWREEEMVHSFPWKLESCCFCNF